MIFSNYTACSAKCSDSCVNFSTSENTTTLVNVGDQYVTNKTKKYTNGGSYCTILVVDPNANECQYSNGVSNYS